MFFHALFINLRENYLFSQQLLLNKSAMVQYNIFVCGKYTEKDKK